MEIHSGKVLILHMKSCNADLSRLWYVKYLYSKHERCQKDNISLNKFHRYVCVCSVVSDSRQPPGL